MHAALLELSAPALPDRRSVMKQADAENFPVAARVLSPRHRRHLLAVYGFARLADDLGDELVGDRLAALDWLELELDHAYDGRARHPLLQRLQRTLAECPLPREPLRKLIDANRLDQRVRRYQTWEQLLGYCELSANPVGELVLCVFGLSSGERIELSNRVCTALQLVEHLQDVLEDLQRDRIYLPAEDLARFGCSHDELARLGSCASGLDLKSVGRLRDSASSGNQVGTSNQLRATVEFETVRARELIRAGVPLVKSIPGPPKLAVGAFVAGGRAALSQLEDAHFDVLAGIPRASRPRRLFALAKVLAESRV